MNWSWSAEEDEAMDYLPHAAQVLYLRVLRRRMDYSSGIVGVSVRLSYQLIGEWLEVRPPWGSKNPVVRLTVSEIRAAFAQLEKVGLIVRVRDGAGEAIPLVFSLPFARTGLIHLKKERQEEQQQNQKGTTAISIQTKQQISALFSVSKSTIYRSKMPVDNSPKIGKKIARNDSNFAEERQEERQTSGMSSLCLTNNIIHARGNNCLIADDWLPGVAVVELVVSELGLSPEFLKRKAMEFRILWRDQNVIALDWDRYFYGACKNRVAERDGEFITAQKNFRGGDRE